MEKTITAMFARKNFGQLLNEVSLLNETFVIHRAGRPMAALVPVSSEQENIRETEIIAAFHNLVKKIKEPRSKKLEKAIKEMCLVLQCEPEP